MHEIHLQRISCHTCGVGFPIFEGIPLLVANVESHLKEIDRLAAQNPGWFNSDQVRYYDEGPYRDHLRRRQQYVSHTITSLIIRKAAPPASIRMLDLGCGDGANLRWLQPLGCNLFAADYNLARLIKTRRATPSSVKIVLTNIATRPFISGYFDIVFFNHVLEHIKDDKDALKNIHHIVASGGYVILGTPNEGSLWWQLAYKLEPESLARTDHKHFYTGDSLKNLCQEAGFEVVELKYIGYGLPHWSADAVFRSIPGIDDLMEQIGTKFFPDQASSLYLILRKITS
jgi:2-polyprenyl-3-methyl-5-hydroxy-6-metoxy-1,4-benzoquinol methylase